MFSKSSFVFFIMGVGCCRREKSLTIETNVSSANGKSFFLPFSAASFFPSSLSYTFLFFSFSFSFIAE